MKKILFMLILCSIFISPSLIFGSHVPIPPDRVLEMENYIRVFLKYGSYTPTLSLEGRWEDENLQFRYRAITLGGYYRATKHLKVGAFYRLQQGARHDDNWINLDPGWAWWDTRGRTEHVLLLDATPRFLLDFLPGQSWVFTLKNRYLFNTYNSQHTLTVRPGITYFLLRNREPRFNFSFNYDFYIPLNYGDTFLYAHWPYLNVLYHVSGIVKLDFSAAYKTVTWSTSEDAILAGESEYTVRANSLVFGLGMILQFEL